MTLSFGCEMKKIVFKKRTLLFFLLVLVILTTLFLSSLDHNNHKSDWKKELKTENISYKKKIKTSNKELKEVYVNKIQKNNYLIKENINPYAKNQFSFTEKSLPIFLLLHVYAIVIASTSVTNEYKYQTIKNIKVSPQNNIKSILGKFLSCSLLMFVFVFLIFLVTITFGGVTYGFTDILNKNVFSLNNDIYIDYDIVYILELYGSEFIIMLVMMSLSFLISSVLKNTTITIIISLLTLIFYGDISTKLRELNIPKIDIFYLLNIKKNILTPNIAENAIDISVNISLLLCYILIFLTFSIIFFDKKRM